MIEEGKNSEYKKKLLIEEGSSTIDDYEFDVQDYWRNIWWGLRESGVVFVTWEKKDLLSRVNLQLLDFSSHALHAQVGDAFFNFRFFKKF